MQIDNISGSPSTDGAVMTPVVAPTFWSKNIEAVVDVITKKKYGCVKLSPDDIQIVKKHLCPHKVEVGGTSCLTCGTPTTINEYSDLISFEDNVRYKILAGQRSGNDELIQIVRLRCSHYYSMITQTDYKTEYCDEYDQHGHHVNYYHKECLICGHKCVTIFSASN